MEKYFMKKILLSGILFLFCMMIQIVPALAGNLAVADLDGDGQITPADLKLLTRDLNTLVAAHRGDINGDNYVDERDVGDMARMLLVRSGKKEEELTQQQIDQFVNAVVNDSRIVVSDGTSDWFDSSAGGDSQDSDYEDILRGGGRGSTTSGNTGATTPGVNQNTSLTDPGNNGTGTSSTSSGRGISSSGGGSSSRPVPNVVGRPPDFPTETRDYFKNLLLPSSISNMTRATVTLDIDTINQRRRSAGMALGASPVDDFLLRTEGKSLTDISPGEPEDATTYNTLGGPADSMDSRIAERRRTPQLRSSNSLGSTGRELLPKAPQDMLLDTDNPENIQLYDTRRCTAEELKTEYTTVSPWDDTEDSSALDNDVRTNSIDPVASQAIKDMTTGGTFTQIADTDGDGTTTRTEMMRTLFNPETATLAKNGNLEQVGIDSGSTTGTEYEQIFDDIKDTLISNGVITPQEVTQIEQVFNPPPPPPTVASTSGGNSSGGIGDALSAGLDAIAGGAAGGTISGTAGNAGTTSSAPTSSIRPKPRPDDLNTTSNIPIPTPRPDDLGTSTPIDHSGEPGYRPGQ
jgi:hypothetical protein